MKRWVFLPASLLLVLFLSYPFYQELGEIADRQQAREEFQSTQRSGSPVHHRGNPPPEAWRKLGSDLRSRLRSIGFRPATLAPGQRGFTLRDLEGEPHRLRDYRGRWVLINFWATWCPPCRMEMPSFQELWRTFRDRGFVLLAVDLQEQPYRVREFANRYDLTFPVLIDRDGAVGVRYRVGGVPETWLVNPGGVPVARVTGPHRWNEEATLELFSDLLEDNSGGSPTE